MFVHEAVLEAAMRHAFDRFALIVILSIPSYANAASLEWLGPCQGGTISQVKGFGLSADGSVAVFRSWGNQWVRWTRSGGAQILGDTSYGEPNAINASGTVVVGGWNNQPAVWSIDTGMHLLWSGAFGLSTAVDASGNVFAGYLQNGTFQAWVGSADGGTTLLPSSYYAFPEGISGDGSLIVGYNAVAGTFGATLWRYDPNAEVGAPTWPVQFLGSDLPGAGPGCMTVASAASHDGTVVVGGDRTCGAWSWTTAGGFVNLGYLDVPPGYGQYPEAWACNSDASLVVGAAFTASSSATHTTAFLWEAVHGMRDLGSVLSNDYRVNIPTGTQLLLAGAISADGATILGLGINPADGSEQAFLATLIAPVAPPKQAPAMPTRFTVLLAALMAYAGVRARRRFALG